MAFYSSSYYNTDLSDYELTSYGGSYDFPPTQSLMDYSSHDFSEPRFIEYDQTPYYGAYDHAPRQSVISYSVSTFSEPNLIQYDPEYGGVYNPAKTQFMISYSTTDYNDPDLDFIEYDPTPFCGGYDPSVTYGKPLPPSDEICYPRSTLDPTALPLNGFSNGSVPSPYGKVEVDDYKAKPSNGIEPTKPNEVEQPEVGDDKGKPSDGIKATEANELEQQSPGGNGGGLTHDLGETIDSNQGEEREGTSCDDYYPWSGYGNGRCEEYGYGYGNQVPQTPCGYGSDATSFCENIFGYWPCLSGKKYGGQQVANEESNCNQWKGTADYFFGSSYPYGDQRDGSSYGNPIYGYERHYQEPLQYKQIEHDEY